MKLSDVMSNAGLGGFAEWALIIFVVAFVAVCVWVLTRPQREIDRQAQIPLDSDQELKDSGNGSRS